VRFLKYVGLTAIVLAAWWTGETGHAAFDPMQHVFGGRWQGWAGALALIVLAAALVYFRFWCRYFCPIGALLNLGNKLALLQGVAAPRRIERCDLGVTHQHDVDCIRCQRCIDGRDLGLPHRAPAHGAGTPILDKGQE
jgi:polyferredoxin